MGDAAVTGVRRRAPKSRAMHAAMVIAVGFALIILAGALPSVVAVLFTSYRLSAGTSNVRF